MRGTVHNPLAPLEAFMQEVRDKLSRQATQIEQLRQEVKKARQGTRLHSGLSKIGEALREAEGRESTPSRDTVRSMILGGALRADLRDGRWICSDADIEDFIQRLLSTGNRYDGPHTEAGRQQMRIAA